MAGTIAAQPPEISAEQIPRIFEAAHVVAGISEERFGAYLKMEDQYVPEAPGLEDALGRLSVPNLARVSVGDYLESSGDDLEDADTVREFLTEKRLLAQSGWILRPVALARLALPMYLARLERTIEAHGNKPLTVSRFADSLRDTIMAVGGTSEPGPRDGPVNGKVLSADITKGYFTLTSLPEAEGADLQPLYIVQPVKTTGKNEGRRQVRIEAAEVEEAQAEG